jgi:hypothetical protein
MHPALRLAIGPILSASFAGTLWLVDLGQPNRAPERVFAVGPNAGEGDSWPGVAVSSSDPAGLVAAEFAERETEEADVEALAQLADRGAWAYGLAASGDARFIELAATLADLHYIREGRMWCDERYGESLDFCVFNIDFVACRQGESDVAKVVYARAIVDWQERPDQHELCPAHVACIARARVGSLVPMPDLGNPGSVDSADSAECIGVHEALSHRNFPRPRWFEDRAKLISSIQSWQNTVDDPWNQYDPDKPSDRLAILQAKNTLTYMKMTLEERFGE